MKPSNHLRCLKVLCILSMTMLSLTNTASPALAALITYGFSGTIAEVSENENDAIPGLAVGDAFTGSTTFESTGWHGTSGTVRTIINGVDLLFTGQAIYGEVDVQPATSYSIRIAGDTAGLLVGSTFSAGNFGPDLRDTDGSAGHTTPFPNSLNLAEFEQNLFRIMGTLVSGNHRIFATGQLTEFFLVPEPTSLLLAACALGVLPLYSRRIRTR